MKIREIDLGIEEVRQFIIEPYYIQVTAHIDTDEIVVSHSYHRRRYRRQAGRAVRVIRRRYLK